MLNWIKISDKKRPVNYQSVWVVLRQSKEVKMAYYQDLDNLWVLEYSGGTTHYFTGVAYWHPMVVPEPPPGDY